MKASYILVRTLLAVSLMTVMTIAAAKAAGTGHGGGGGYVKNQDGSLIFRDFIKSGRPRMVPDSVSFVQETPRFSELISELIDVHPQFAILVINQYTHLTNIWTTTDPLPVLPESETTLLGPKVDVQAATRYGNDIVISMPDFKKGQVEEYVLLHEALHGIVGGVGPIQEMYVGNVVDFIKENRGKLNLQTLQSYLRKNQANVPDLNEKDRVRMQQLLKGHVSDPLTCAIFGADVRRYEGYPRDLLHYKTVSVWRKELSCKKDDDLDYIAAKFPNLSNFMEGKSSLRYFPSAPYIYAVTKPTGWFISSEQKKFFAEHCESYSGPKMQEEIATASQKMASAIAVANAARAEYATMISNQLPLTEKYFFEIFMEKNGPLYNRLERVNTYSMFINPPDKLEKYISENAEEIHKQREAEEILKANLLTCAKE